jgi:PEP-CTERM motif
MFAAQKIEGRKFYWLLLAALSLTLSAYGQGTFVYDQQSAVEGVGGESGGFLQTGQPFGQSFTPALSSIDFVRFLVYDVFPNNDLGASIVVNLRSNSISGPVLASTLPLSLPDGFGSVTRGYTNFSFATSVPLAPGVTYYAQPVVLSGGDTWAAIGSDTFNYAGGTMFVNGAPRPPGYYDLWFREGIVVPEPSSATLVLLGSGILFYVRRAKKQR